jgi:hypothetical protein
VTHNSPFAGFTLADSAHLSQARMVTIPQTHLDAATGWLELGNWHEANEELERLPPELRAVPEVLLLRCRIYALAGRWDDVALIAEGGASTYPNRAQFCTHWAWALPRQGRTAEGAGGRSVQGGTASGKAGPSPTRSRASMGRLAEPTRRGRGSRRHSNGRTTRTR